MYRAGRIIVMAAGLAMMWIVLVMFGFVETGIPNIGYLAMWGGCAGMVYYGSGITGRNQR